MSEEAFIPVHAIKGRGAATRLAHRFAKDERSAFDDGWGTLHAAQAEDEDLPPLATQVRFEDVKSALTGNESPDVYFERSLNPYRGCEHVMRNSFCSIFGVKRWQTTFERVSTPLLRAGDDPRSPFSIWLRANVVKVKSLISSPQVLGNLMGTDETPTPPAKSSPQMLQV